MKRIRKAWQVLHDWALTDSMDAVEEVCEALELLDGYLKDNSIKCPDEEDPIDSPCNIDPKHLGGFTNTQSMGCDIDYTKCCICGKVDFICMPYIPLQITSAKVDAPDPMPMTLADIPFKDIELEQEVWFNGTINKGHPSEKTFVNLNCLVYRKEDYGRIALWSEKEQMYISTDEFCNVSFYPIPDDSIMDAEFEDDNRWNCKCPVCGSDAYQGLGKITCSQKDCKC